jgi:hypothetical protein
LTDETERWESLNSELNELAKIEFPDEFQVGKLNSLLGSVNLIQPFDWMSWSATFPSTEEIASLSLLDCVKQVTRLSRADRTHEGILWGALRAGALEALCLAAYKQSGGRLIGSLRELSTDD